MRVQSEKSFKSTIRPVLLASSRQRRLWPLSTPETPFCLRSVNGRPATLVRALQALESTPAFGPPIVLLAESAARLGISEVTRVRPDADIIIVPEGIGSGIAALLAAIETADSCASSHLALIPGSFFAADPVAAFQSLASISYELTQQNQIALMTTRSNWSDSVIHVELGERIPGSHLFHAKTLHRIIAFEMKSALLEANALVCGAGPVIVKTHGLIKHVQMNFPTTFVACSNAVKLAEHYGKTFRPQRDFLSFAGRPSIRDYFQSALQNMFVYLGNPDWRTIETFRDPLFESLASQPNTPVAIAGPGDHKIIASNDGVLVLKPGYEDTVKNFYDDVSITAPAMNRPTTKGPSLRFTA